MGKEHDGGELRVVGFSTQRLAVFELCVCVHTRRQCNVIQLGGGTDYRAGHPEYLGGLWVQSEGAQGELEAEGAQGELEAAFEAMSGVPISRAEPDEAEVVMGRREWHSPPFPRTASLTRFCSHSRLSPPTLKQNSSNLGAGSLDLEF